MAERPSRSILLVEDNPGDADLIQDMLAEAPRTSRAKVIHVLNLSDASTILGSLPIEAVLLDLRLPDGSGVDCVRTVREHARMVPIVVLTGLDDEDLAMSCIAAGAQDYLSKSEVRSRALSRAIEYAVVRMQEAHERRRAEDAGRRSAELERENVRILEASRAKSAFLATMSHELRTPLNAIIGFAELIVDRKVDPASPTHDTFVGHILNSGRHLLDLINDILDLAKVEAGKFEFRPEPAALAPLVRDIVDIVEAAFPAKQVMADVHVEAGLDVVWIDPGRFRQVLYNYLSNAFKVVAPRGKVAVRAVVLDEQWFRVEVEDTGPGIAPKDIARLFMDFQQLRSQEGQLQSGTGLGLALTKRLVEAQGGSVAVSSQVGRGSVFSAVLRRVRETQEAS